MNSLHHHGKELGFMPVQGRCSRQLCDHRLKVKVRRQERRKSRELIRIWLGEGQADVAFN
jgi:peptidyl-tRNA hydrolase